MSSALFESLRMRGLTVPNRIVVSPMCQYSAVQGDATDWHIIHLGQYAVSNAGLIIIEATGVEPAGRITASCLGLWSDSNQESLDRVLKAVRPYATMPIGIQLGHAGRKASVRPPGQGRGNLDPKDGGWQTFGPTNSAFGSEWRAPKALDKAGMQRVINAFVQAAHRADDLGLDLIEIHAAHGYLLSSYLSPVSNTRRDEYGGNQENRMRFPLEVFKAVRDVWPERKPLGVRFNGTDWVEHGLQVEDAIEFAQALKALGCDYMDLSSGGNARAKIPLEPGYQVEFAQAVKRETQVATICVGLIRDPLHAETIVATGQADMVALGRGFLYDPRWVWRAAQVLNVPIEVTHQYIRGATPQGLASQDTILDESSVQK